MRITHFTLVWLCLVLSVSVATAKEKQPAHMDHEAMMEVKVGPLSVEKAFTA